MARIRTIKPEFFTSEDIVSLTPLARLFYVSLWCEADREGRLDWRIGTLKMRYFPGDNCDMQELAKELIDGGLIVVYEVDGKQYAEIPSFKTHQIINNRESESTRPPRVKHACKRVKAEGKEGREGKGKEGDSAEPQRDSPPVALIPLVDGQEAAFTQAQVDDWARAYPAVDVAQQLRQMRAWCIANPTRRKTARGVEAFVVGWLTKEQNSGRTAKTGSGGTGPKPGTDEYAALHKTAGWWREAGFDTVWDAMASKCWHTNAHLFRDGKKAQVAA